MTTFIACREDLQKQLQHLEHEWNSYKTSITSRRRRRHCSPSSSDLLRLLDASPKKLLSSLQRAGFPTRAGELKGRKLLDALERAKEDTGEQEEETCSICSSVVVQNWALRSPPCSCCSSEFSSSRSLAAEEEDVQEVVVGGGGGERRRRWVVRVGWVVVVSIVLGLCWAMARELGLDDDGDYFVPT